MGAGLGIVDAEIDAFRIGVPDGRALTRQIGQENQPVRARGNPGRLLVHAAERVFRAVRVFLRAELPQEPAERPAAHRAALQQPAARHHVLPQYQALVGFELPRAEGHAARLAALFLCLAGADDPRAERPAGGVQTARHHRGPAAQAGLLRGAGMDRSDHLAAGGQAGQLFKVDAEQVRRPFVPRAPAHVEAVQPVPLRDVLRDGARQPVDDVAVGLQNPAGPPVKVRPVPLEPQDFSRGVRGLQRVAAEAEKLLRFGTGVPLRAQARRAGIHPDRVAAEHPAFPVQQDAGPALPVHADPGDLRGRDARAFQHRAHRCAEGLPPVLGVLLHPAGGGVGDRISLRALGGRFPVRRKKRRLARRRADVDSQ